MPVWQSAFFIYVIEQYEVIILIKRMPSLNIKKKGFPYNMKWKIMMYNTNTENCKNTSMTFQMSLNIQSLNNRLWCVFMFFIVILLLFVNLLKYCFVIYRLPDDWCINYIHETTH